MRAPIILIRATDLAQLTNEELRPAKHYDITTGREHWPKLHRASASVWNTVGDGARQSPNALTDAELVSLAKSRGDHKPDGSGLDDGPWLPGCAPRKKPAPKSADEMVAIRAKAWATRRAPRDERGR
jgi:hypothetical protein